VIDFREAGRRLAAKDRSFRDKQMGLADAVRLVHDGHDVAVGGCLYSRTPMASLFEILRQGRTGLTLSRSLMCYEAELFMVRGAANRIVTSWVGIGLPWGIAKVFRRYVEEGRAVYEEWSHLALGLRYRAASMGVPFLPTMSMLGSDLLPRTDAVVMDCPFTGQPLCLVPAYFPDVALIHVHRADRFGNAQIDGYPFMDQEIAGAAQTVIVTAEEIVEPEEIVRRSDATLLPHFVVDAVVEVPFGSFPHECYGRYEALFSHFDEYVGRVEESGPDGVERYLAEYVDGPDDFEGFLARFGPDVLADQQARAAELVAG
jgi:glutaconate CoA-transferase, subunit A